jgi:hypothetical protein
MGYSCLRWIVLYYIKIFAYFYTIRNNINSWSLKVDFFYTEPWLIWILVSLIIVSKPRDNSVARKLFWAKLTKYWHLTSQRVYISFGQGPGFSPRFSSYILFINETFIKQFKIDENSVCSMTNSEFSNFIEHCYLLTGKGFVKEVNKANRAKFV